METAHEVDPTIGILLGGRRFFFDPKLGKLDTTVVYVPWGCRDWGEDEAGRRLGVCTFCELPNVAAAYRNEFPEPGRGSNFSDAYYVELFRKTLQAAMRIDGNAEMLQIFNAGSWFAMPPDVQLGIAEEICRYPSIGHVVVESRVVSRKNRWLITEENASALVSSLPGRRVTVRVGVETKDHETRIARLRKGHTEEQLIRGASVLRGQGIIASCYVMVLGRGMSRFDDYGAVLEGRQTVDWVFALGYEQVCIRPVFIEPNTAMTWLWERGEISPATLWVMNEVLRAAVAKHGSGIILLVFKETPPFRAISSNHAPRGIAGDLSDAQGCDREFHGLFERFRESNDPAVLEVYPACSCMPPWIEPRRPG